MVDPDRDALKQALIEAIAIGLIATRALAAGGLFTRQSHHKSALLGGIWPSVSAVVVYGADCGHVCGKWRRLLGTVLGAR